MESKGPDPSWSGKRYFPFSVWLRKKFGERVFKIPLHAGMTCPNLDGTLARGGCTYCDNRSFSPTLQQGNASVREQIERGMSFYRKTRKARKFIAYFQTFTNTYAPVERLRTLYDEATAFEDIVGLAIATRPDCAQEEALDLVASYRERGLDVWLEYGLQTIHDATQQATNRLHRYGDFLDALQRTRRRGLPVSVHVILGLPGETPEMMRQTARALAMLDFQAIKIHHCYVSPGTVLEKQYRSGEYVPLGLPQYVELVCDFLELLPGSVAIQRLLGELPGPYVIAPDWGAAKSEILQRIDRELDRRESWQGKRVRAELTIPDGLPGQVVSGSARRAFSAEGRRAFPE